MADCEKIKELMTLRIDNEISIEDKSVFDEHIASCESCRQEYDSLVSLIGEINSLEEIELPDNFHAEAMEKIKKSNVRSFNINKIDWRQFSSAAAVFLLAVMLVSTAITGVDLLFNKNFKTEQNSLSQDQSGSGLTGGYDYQEAEIYGTAAVSPPAAPTSYPAQAADEKAAVAGGLENNEASDTTPETAASTQAPAVAGMGAMKQDAGILQDSAAEADIAEEPEAERNMLPESSGMVALTGDYDSAEAGMNTFSSDAVPSRMSEPAGDDSIKLTDEPEYDGAPMPSETYGGEIEQAQDIAKIPEAEDADTQSLDLSDEVILVTAQGLEAQPEEPAGEWQNNLSVSDYGSAEKNVKSYTISITVDDVTEAVQAINGLGGHTVKSEISQYSEYNTYANISIAVDDARFYSTVDALKGLGEVMLETQGQYSVLTDAKDAYAHYIVKLEERNRLMELLAKTETADNMLFVENRLNQVIDEMESYKTQINNYNEISNSPVIEIRLVQKEKPKNAEQEDEVSFVAKVAEAFFVSISIVVLFSQLIMLLFAYIWLPVLIVGICAVVVLRVRKRSRR